MQQQPDRPSMSAWQVVLAGMVALGVAMGIGRFAFTPILPMMLADGVTDLAQASWLASANYLGYLVGAVWCTFQPWIWRRLGWHRAVDHGISGTRRREDRRSAQRPLHRA